MRACLSGGLTFSCCPSFLLRHSGAERSDGPGIHTPDRGYGFRARIFDAPRNDNDDLMIIPRDADFARDVLIARGEFHAGAGGLLADGRAIEFLPRRLVR